MKEDFSQKGQALLVVLLVMVVGLTIGLSLATRSVTDIKISTQLEESSRAFSAAEAGIEAALKGEAAPTSPVQIGNATYTFSSTTTGGTTGLYSLPDKLSIADTSTVWLTSHDASGNLQVDESFDYDGTRIIACWGDGTETVKPAMEVTIFYKEGANYKAQRGAYDPDSNRRNSNKFADIETGVNCDGVFAYGKTVSLPSALLIALRLRPFYSETKAGVMPPTGGTSSLPQQGLSITSTGTIGETTRKVEVIQVYSSPPAIFDYVLFSGTGVSK